MTRYDQTFFDYVSEGALRSARLVLPHLDALDVQSVLDVGCGQGAWLSVWREFGAAEITGVDGEYVDPSRLLIDREAFIPADLNQPFDLGRQFDLAQSLEVGEHLPADSARSFVTSLTRHADLVLFSAAPPGQGGETHINEQPYDYWRALFAEQGYMPVDYLRPNLGGDTRIEPWYRYNCFLYANARAMERLPSEMRAALVDAEQPLIDISPTMYRLRKGVIRLLPSRLMSHLARLKMLIRTRMPMAGGLGK